MDKWFKSKWFVRVISLAFAILLYIVVSVELSETQSNPRLFGGTDDLQSVEDVPLEIRIDEDNYIVSGVPEYVNVSLEGSTSTLAPIIRQKNFDVFVDLEGLDVGEHTVEVEHENIPNDVNVYVEPRTIDVTVEQRASEEFDVKVDFINVNQLPEGYEVGEVEVNPGSVTITSSKNIIDRIALVKVFVDVSDASESINNREVPVNVYDSQGNELNVRVEPETVEASIEIDNPSKTVPVSAATTGDLPSGYSLNSISVNVDEIEVFATNEILSQIEEILTEDINLATVTESQTMESNLSLPDGARTSGGGTVEVTIEVEETRTINELPIEVENLDDGQDVSFIQPNEPEMSVTVVGNQEIVSGLTADDFRLFIDVEDLDEGEHQVPVTIEGPEDITYTAEFEEVTIQIS
ncbi:YbbR-like domain-containing protein [Virgibacillus byunsanensis]|uniref:YbbR-like domain-containing protein n=1 Tax=Virgibacillus byunsanensis TaxID=570945 RepID=A0ABW3LH66_9BACI